MTPLVSPPLLERLKTLRDLLETNILGQSEILEDVVRLLSRTVCGLRFLDRPIASMLFLGPTGVGKTETALLFTKHLFRSEEKLARLDMSEYMTVDSIAVLRGSNIQERGLFGHYYDRTQGSGTLLFDEIEKAHPLIVDVFLQILSAGRFTLANGETLDLRNYIVVATTNIGVRVLMESRTTDRETIETRGIQAATTEMRPEIFRRFNRAYVFNKLGFMTLKQIGQLHCVKAVDIINAQGHEIKIEPSVIEYVQREGYSEKYGAAPMQEAAMRIIGDIVAAEMLVNGGNRVTGVIHHDRRSNKAVLQK
jgi:ATP-dependent Clp protease ATP-binding subunit ClpA